MEKPEVGYVFAQTTTRHTLLALLSQGLSVLCIIGIQINECILNLKTHRLYYNRWHQYISQSSLFNLTWIDY